MKSYKEDHRPSFQFYPDDWLSESSLKLCSLEAKGLWIEMLMIMFNAGKRGALTVNGVQIRSKELAKLVGEKEETVSSLLKEMEAYNVFTKLDNDLIINRRMYYQAERTKQIHEARVRAGRKGGSSKRGSKKVAKQAAPTSSASSTPTPTSKHKKHFVSPTVEEASSYIKEKNYPVNAQAFVDYYQARGWKYKNGQPMADWKAAVRTWVHNNKHSGKKFSGKDATDDAEVKRLFE